MSEYPSEEERNNIILSLQDILYDHPLYELIDPQAGEDHINLLIMGFSGYGRDFADLCLQVGQMADYSIDVSVYSQSQGADTNIYLSDRPELSRFVNINGSLSKDSRSYGDLRILDISDVSGFDATDPVHAVNRDAVLSILHEANERERPYNYIFIDFGNDAINYDMADLFGKQTQGQKDQCPICYISREPGMHNEESGRMISVCASSVHEKISSLKDANVLDLEAFRTHLSWLGTLNFDVDEEFNKFKADTYNYISSRAYALSIRYKLYSAGIILKKEFRFKDPGSLVIVKDEFEAARKFSDNVLNAKGKNHDLFNRLVMLEHRRWVLSLVTQGWIAPRNRAGDLLLTRCVSEGTVKNKDKKTHPCIVFSTEDAPLDSPEYTKNNHAKWEEESIDPALDELDHMSVKLHQLFRAEAKKKISQDPLSSEAIADIEKLIISMDQDIRLCFKQFKYCLSNIINGNIPYIRQYDVYRNYFTQALSAHSIKGEAISKISEDLSVVDADFFPIKEANLYRNYKAYDNVLVENIPYILTWPLRPSVMMAFDDGRYDAGRNDKIFANVASATVLCPSRIHYIYYYDRDSDPDRLCSKLLAVKNYLEKRSINTKIILTIAYSKGLGKRQINTLNDALKKTQSLPKKDSEKVEVDILKPYECKNTDGIYDSFCKEILIESPDFFDGSTHLFASAKMNAEFYNKFSGLKIPYFEFDRKRKLFTANTACDYLNFMIDESFIRIDDMFALMNAGIDYGHIKKETHFPNFPDNFGSLWNIYMGDYCRNNYKKSSGYWNDLCASIKNINCPRLEAKGIPVKNSGVKKLLERLQRKGFIKNLRFDDINNPKSADFIFDSPETRIVFEKAGEILEIYVYYEALKTGYFDDVAMSYSFKWNGGNVGNELDLVLTKGYRSIIVECKAVESLDQDYYYKLQTISQNFGIGSLAVLIGNMKKSGMSNSDQATKIRGDQLNIVTIFDRGEITNIGEILRLLMQKMD